VVGTKLGTISLLFILFSKVHALPQGSTLNARERERGIRSVGFKSRGVRANGKMIEWDTYDPHRNLKAHEITQANVSWRNARDFDRYMVRSQELRDKSPGQNDPI
jgi:hypothetical protein